jgi:hypothetical protein
LISGVSIFVAYFLLLGLAREGVADGEWPRLSLWWVHVAFVTPWLALAWQRHVAGAPG